MAGRTRLSLYLVLSFRREHGERDLLEHGQIADNATAAYALRLVGRYGRKSEGNTIMRILVVPMFALSRMGGPWSRAQKISAAFMEAGHDVTMGVAHDGNCTGPVAPHVVELPAPSPLGLPMPLSSRAFPIAERLGIAGRRPVRSFEEVLWLTGALSHRYEAQSVELLRRHIRSERVDVVYSEFSLPAIIAAQAEGVPCVGTASYPTQAAYACDPSKAKGVRRLLSELALPDVATSLDLFGRMERRFVPSCAELEPLESDNVVFCGFLDGKAATREARSAASRDAIVVYMGMGSVPRAAVMRVASALAESTGRHVYVAGFAGSPFDEGGLHVAERFDFSELLPRACAFVNHGGQNSVMDALAYGVPQVICPGRVFERRFNAQSVELAGAGVCLGRFDEPTVLRTIERITREGSFEAKADELRDSLASLGGTATIVAKVECLPACK